VLSAGAQGVKSIGGGRRGPGSRRRLGAGL